VQKLSLLRHYISEACLIANHFNKWKNNNRRCPMFALRASCHLAFSMHRRL